MVPREAKGFCAVAALKSEVERLPAREDMADEEDAMFTRIKAIARSLTEELAFYRLVLSDRRTPRIAKALLALAVGYFLSPVDLIPDFIPVLGQLDDAVIVPSLVYVALKLIPPEVVEDCRRQVTAVSGRLVK